VARPCTTRSLLWPGVVSNLYQSEHLYAISIRQNVLCSFTGDDVQAYNFLVPTLSLMYKWVADEQREGEVSWVKGKAATKHATVMAVGVLLNRVPTLCLMPDRPDGIDTHIRRDSVGNFSGRGIAWGVDRPRTDRSLPPLSGVLHISHHLQSLIIIGSVCHISSTR